MSEKQKIKDSFPKRKYSLGKSISEENLTKPTRTSLFVPFSCAIFFIHWIILCPLIWAMLYKTIYSKYWPRYWVYLFWIFAFIIYIIIMACFIAFWRRRKANKEKTEDKAIEIVTLSNNENEKKLSSTEEEKIEPAKLKNTDKNKMNLPPLVIHKNMSGASGKDDSGDVTIRRKFEEKSPTENLSRISEEINRRSMKEYLKIVTVETPSPSTKSQRPMSPRELFFIDLIEGAKKVEEDKTKNKDQVEEINLPQRKITSNIFTYDEIKEDNGEEKEEIAKDKEKINLKKFPDLRITLTEEKIKEEIIEKKMTDERSENDEKVEKVEKRKKKFDKPIFTETNVTEEQKFLRINQTSGEIKDTRRYTMGDEAFKNLFASSNIKRLSKSETILPKITEQTEEIVIIPTSKDKNVKFNKSEKN